MIIDDYWTQKALQMTYIIMAIKDNNEPKKQSQ